MAKICLFQTINYFIPLLLILIFSTYYWSDPTVQPSAPLMVVSNQYPVAFLLFQACFCDFAFVFNMLALSTVLILFIACVCVCVFLLWQRFDIKKKATVRNSGCKAIAKRLVKFNFQADFSNFTTEWLFYST